MTFKLLTKRFIVLILMAILIIIVGMAIYDPLHIYHKSWVTKNDRIHGNMRLQAAGIINNYDFDSIIIGTSMMKGTSSILASEKIGGKFVNLSSDGSSIFERKYIINYALKNKNIKSVIISFDTGLDLNIKKFHHRFPRDRFEFLYDDIYLNDFKAYWNYKFIGCFATLSTSINCLGDIRSIQRPKKWFDDVYKINKNISGIRNWVDKKKGRGKSVYSRIKRHLEHPIRSKYEYSKKLSLTQTIIQSSLFSIIQENENVDFHVVFPPYSRFLYSLWFNKDPYKYLLYKDTLRYLVMLGQGFNNLKVYSFDNMEYLNNLNNYRDMRHYNTDMNEIILNAIKEHENIISNDNVNSFIELLDKINADYKLDNELNYLLNSYSYKYKNVHN